MALSKKDRQTIHDKYDGRCAYCGDPLEKGWHVDHLLAVERVLKWNGKLRKWVKTNQMRKPENDHIGNCMPSCPSCNINKHSHSLEWFRKLISGFLKSLNRDITQYKIAKRYGFIKEIEQPVVFYFEKIENNVEATPN